MTISFVLDLNILVRLGNLLFIFIVPFRLFHLFEPLLSEVTFDFIVFLAVQGNVTLLVAQVTLNTEQGVITIFGPESLLDPLNYFPLLLIFFGGTHKIVLHESEYFCEILAPCCCTPRLSCEKGDFTDEYIDRNLGYKSR